MRLLSRNAEALFWLARYLERGASLARVIEMQSAFGAAESTTGWNWLLALHNDEERFKERFEVSSANIVSFYVTDNENVGSIRSSIHWARENARGLRPFIPLEMWVQLNSFHSTVEGLTADDIASSALARTCSLIRGGCLAQIGTAEGTLFRDEGYQFFMLGLLVERADQTSRLLDVKFAQVAAADRVDPGDDFVFWSTILRTAGAFQVFNRLESGGATPDRVARFLMLNPSHPRSIGFCVREIAEALQRLRGSFRLRRANRCQERCEVLMDGLQAAGRDADLASRLHDINDWVQRSLCELTDTISAAFFELRSPEPVPAKPETAPTVESQTPSQSQTQSQSGKAPAGQTQTQRQS